MQIEKHSGGWGLAIGDWGLERWGSMESREAGVEKN